MVEFPDTFQNLVRILCNGRPLASINDISAYLMTESPASTIEETLGILFGNPDKQELYEIDLKLLSFTFHWKKDRFNFMEQEVTADEIKKALEQLSIKPKIDQKVYIRKMLDFYNWYPNLLSQLDMGSGDFSTYIDLVTHLKHVDEIEGSTGIARYGQIMKYVISISKIQAGKKHASEKELFAHAKESERNGVLNIMREMFYGSVYELREKMDSDFNLDRIMASFVRDSQRARGKNMEDYTRVRALMKNSNPETARYILSNYKDFIALEDSVSFELETIANQESSLRIVSGYIGFRRRSEMNKAKLFLLLGKKNLPNYEIEAIGKALQGISDANLKWAANAKELPIDYADLLRVKDMPVLKEAKGKKDESRYLSGPNYLANAYRILIGYDKKIVFALNYFMEKDQGNLETFCNNVIDLSRTVNGKEVLLKVIKEEKLFKAYKQKISTAPAKLLEIGNTKYSDQSKLNSAIQAELR